jgi:mannose-6-phosphate isomerase
LAHDCVVVAFLMNPVSLRPGEVAYIPPRQIHSYQSGLGIEIMVTSDNVIRAGLTHKHVDATQLVEIAEFSALPPIRLAPEHPKPSTDRFLAPVQEFELSVTTLGEGGVGLQAQLWFPGKDRGTSSPLTMNWN